MYISISPIDYTVQTLELKLKVSEFGQKLIKKEEEKSDHKCTSRAPMELKIGKIRCTSWIGQICVYYLSASEGKNAFINGTNIFF